LSLKFWSCDAILQYSCTDNITNIFLLESNKWSRFEHLNEHCSTMLSLVQNQTALGLWYIICAS
jgi:hypothetical protein